MIAAALKAEADDYVEPMRGVRGEHGHILVVQNARSHQIL
jgi:hypothetical protein